MKNALIGSLMILGAVFSSSAAGAVTIEEYNSVPSDVQSSAIIQIANLTFQNLAKNGASADKLSCIKNFYSQQDINMNGNTLSVIPGIEAILDQIDIANANGDIHLHVEDLLLGTINAHCDGTDIATTPEAPVEPPPTPQPPTQG